MALKAILGDFIKFGTDLPSKVIEIEFGNKNDGNYYYLENGRVFHESEFSFDDVLLESEVY